MKKDFDYADKTVATAALLGNINADVVKRMAMYIVDQTTDSSLICGLLQGLVVDVKINNKEKLAEIIGKQVNEDICEITNIEAIMRDQSIRVTYLCKRYAKSEDETKCYNTSKKQDETFVYIVKVQDSYRLDINRTDWEDSVEFKIV